jgi:hypothetical protein
MGLILSLGVVTNMCSRAALLEIDEKLVAHSHSSMSRSGTALLSFHRLTEEYFAVKEVEA